MQYIVHRRFRGTAICGEVNLPAMTVCACEGNLIIHNGKPICAASSENAHQFFARNDDYKGMERGKLTQAIQKKLSKRDTLYQIRWDIIWADFICQKYRRIEHADYWLWNHAFFNAPIEDLQHIVALVDTER